MWPSHRSCRRRDRKFLDAHVEMPSPSALWDEVKDRFIRSARSFPGAAAAHDHRPRASHQTEILCLDEFSIAIDPVTTMRIGMCSRNCARNDHYSRNQPINNPAGWPSHDVLGMARLSKWTGVKCFFRRTPPISGPAITSTESSDDRRFSVQLTTRDLNLWYAKFQASRTSPQISGMESSPP